MSFAQMSLRTNVTQPSVVGSWPPSSHRQNLKIFWANTTAYFAMPSVTKIKRFISLTTARSRTLQVEPGTLLETPGADFIKLVPVVFAPA
jgi:hypothetical protein